MEIWPIKFLQEYQESEGTAQNALELAIRCTHRPTPLQHFLFRVYGRHFLDAHAEAVREFDKFCDGAQLIAAHVSCQARRHLASASAKSFGDHEQLRHLIVVGQSPAELQCQRYFFESREGILTVPAADTYEGLAVKMAMLFRFLGFSGNASCVMKLDDDIRCDREKFSPEDVIQLSRRYDYVGRVINPRLYGLHRWYNLGKCQDDHLNRSPYSLPVDCNYAVGPAYFLSPRAINILARSSVYLCQAFQQEYSYEDIAMGKILNSFGVHPHHFDPLGAAIFVSTD
jgi:hypothetical protein